MSRQLEVSKAHSVLQTQRLTSTEHAKDQALSEMHTSDHRRWQTQHEQMQKLLQEKVQQISEWEVRCEQLTCQLSLLEQSSSMMPEIQGTATVDHTQDADGDELEMDARTLQHSNASLLKLLGECSTVLCGDDSLLDIHRLEKELEWGRTRLKIEVPMPPMLSSTPCAGQQYLVLRDT